MPFAETNRAEYKKVYSGCPEKCPTKHTTICEKSCHSMKASAMHSNMQVACQPDSLSAFSARFFSRH
jgi:hypothetical protein